MKRIELLDAMTGNILDIEFDLNADKIRINGEEVIRKRALESSDNQFVYGPPSTGPTILFHLTREQVEKMQELWRS